jgi:hypothetical protein
MHQPTPRINGTMFAPKFDRHCLFLPGCLAGYWSKWDSMRRSILSSFEYFLQIDAATAAWFDENW